MNERSVREWIVKAESDLKTGRDEFATENPATDTICFRMQQCVEKYLKAYLIFNGKEIKRTHIKVKVFVLRKLKEKDFKL